MSKTILVVEDQEDNRQILRDLLGAHDYDMLEAENGEEALAAVKRQRPDLILMDIQLPVWTAMRRRAGSRPIRTPRRSRSSWSPPTRCPATKARRASPAATPT